MAKQVWQVEDGGIFDTEAEALEWEESESLIQSVTTHVYQNTCGVSQDDCHEVVQFLVNHYNIAPK